MSKDIYVIRSSIKPEIMRKSVRRAFILGTLGCLILFVSYSFVPKVFFDRWGFVFFFLAYFIIILGFASYLRLCKKEKRPDELVITSEEDKICYYKKNKLVLKIPIKNVRAVGYEEDPKHYGISLTLQNEQEKRVLYFPFFSRRSYLSLKDFLEL